jgi:hypothetical protein
MLKAARANVTSASLPPTEGHDPAWEIAAGGADCVATFTAASLLTTVTTTIVIRHRKPLGIQLAWDLLKPGLETKIDPRGWQDISPAFEETYEVVTVDGQPSYDPSGKPIKGESSAPGKPWNGLLYERVGSALTPDRRAVLFENLLKIVFTDGNDGNGVPELKAEYSLHRALSSIVWTPYAKGGGIDVDWGHLKATKLGNDRVRIEVKKTVRFTDRTPESMRPRGTLDYGLELNYLAGPMICFWQQLDAHGAAFRAAL